MKDRSILEEQKNATAATISERNVQFLKGMAIAQNLRLHNPGQQRYPGNQVDLTHPQLYTENSARSTRSTSRNAQGNCGTRR